MISTEIPKHVCPNCGYVMDQTSEAAGDGKPTAGCISMCLSCGAVRIFNADLTLRDPTAQEWLEITNSDLLRRAKHMRELIVGDKIKRRHEHASRDDE
jgi:RNase P subunit RPR2